jgi:hypothetical protein
MNLRFLSLIAVFVLPAAAARADVFLLRDGGRIDGQWLNADEKPQTKFLIRTAGGATLTLEKDGVKQVVKRSPAEIEYETVRHQYPDTVAGHTALAQWCQEQKLSDQRKLHLERILELDPNNTAARSVLGFAKLGGQWRTREQHLSSMGKVQHKGEWMYPQEIEIVERKAEQTKHRLEWIANLKRWRDWLGGEKEGTGQANITSIRDPAALPAIIQMLEEEKVPAVRILYARAMANIGGYESQRILAEMSLYDMADDVRAICLELLTDQPQPAIANYFIQQLQSKDNAAINRAAYALARFKEPRAVGPLIDSLITRHKFAVTTGNSGGGMSATNSSMGSGLSMGNSTKILQKDMQNQQVLDTLITLVNGEVNYQFNIEAWRQWYAGRKKSQFADARRSQ